MPILTTPLPVLVVDDSADDLFFARRLLAKAQGAVPVLAASSAQEAMQLLAALRDAPGAGPLPGLMLVDMKMPCMDGLEFIAWAVGAGLDRRTTLAMLTTSSRVEDEERAQEAGAHGFYANFPAVDVLRDLLAVTCLRPAGSPPPTGADLPGNLILRRCVLT